MRSRDCSSCGARAPTASMYCPSCGSGLGEEKPEVDPASESEAVSVTVTSQSPSAPKTESRDEERRRVAYLAAGGSAAIVIGSFMPWARVLFVEVAGIDTNSGKLLLILGIVAGLLAYQLFTREGRSGYFIPLGALSALLSFGAISELRSEGSGLISIRPGLLLAALGSVLVVVAGVKGRA